MRNIVYSISGGKTSGEGCELIIDKFGNDPDINLSFVFMDTTAEHPKTYKFLKEINDYYNLDITCLRLKVNPDLGSDNTYQVIDINDCGPDLSAFKAMMAKYGVPYIGGMFCTDRLKLVPFTKYCNDVFGVDNYERWLGIRADEPARIWGDHKQKQHSLIKCLYALGYDSFQTIELWRSMFTMQLTINNVMSRFGCDQRVAKMVLRRFFDISIMKQVHYLAEISDIEKPDVNAFWEKMPFNLEIPEWSGNCVFCPKKSDLKLAAAYHDNKEFYAEYVAALTDPSVRVDKETGVASCMYRGEQSLEKLIAMFDGSTGDEIKSRISGWFVTAVTFSKRKFEIFKLV